MFLFGRSQRLTSRDEMKFRVDAARGDLDLSSAAGALSLVRAGVTLEQSLEEITDHVALVAERYGLDPDATQQLLIGLEAVLGTVEGLAL